MAASYSQPPASEWQFKEARRDCPTCGTEFRVKGTMHRYCSMKCNPSRHPDRLNAALRRSRLKRKYGLTEADFERLVAGQSGECAICGATDDRLVVDHDHATGAVRAILCSACNLAIGLLKEDPKVMDSARQYILKHRPLARTGHQVLQ